MVHLVCIKLTSLADLFISVKIKSDLFQRCIFVTLKFMEYATINQNFTQK